MNTQTKVLFIILIVIVLGSYEKSADISTENHKPAPLTTIFVNGDILTMNDAQPEAQTLAVRDGKILAVGSRSDVPCRTPCPRAVGSY